MLRCFAQHFFVGLVSTGVVYDYLALHPGMEDAYEVEVRAWGCRHGDGNRLARQDEYRVAACLDRPISVETPCCVDPEGVCVACGPAINVLVADWTREATCWNRKPRGWEVLRQVEEERISGSLDARRRADESWGDYVRCATEEDAVESGGKGRGVDEGQGVTVA